MHEHARDILHHVWNSDSVDLCVCVCVSVSVLQEWKDGLASPEDLSPATLQSPSYITDSLIGCTSLPNTQVCLHGILKNKHFLTCCITSCISHV